MHRVVAVANEGVLTFDLAVPCEIFGWDRSYLGVEWYEFKVCAADPPPLRTSTGFSIDTPFGLDELAGADTIVIPGWSDPRHLPSAEQIGLLREAHDRGARIASICVGAFVLGAAGLLDRRPCTTHWAYADELARRFPLACVDPNVLYVDDGQILTSAGTAAGLDLCRHLVRNDHGTEVANAVARRVVTLRIATAGRRSTSSGRCRSTPATMRYGGRARGRSSISRSRSTWSGSLRGRT